MLRDQDAQDCRQPRRCPRLNQRCGADNLTDTDGYEGLYEIDECPLQEGRESPACAGPVFHVRQLCLDSFDPESGTGHTSRHRQSCLVFVRNRGVTQLILLLLSFLGENVLVDIVFRAPPVWTF